MNHTRLICIVALVALAAATRFLPHPPNFSPLAAIALFAGAQMLDRRSALLIPFVIMLLTDVVIGFHSTMPFVYAALALTVLLGRLIGSSPRMPALLGATLGSSVLFFTVTNLGVWLVTGIYPMTAAGLASCFVAAIPFFQNTLLSSLLFSGLLFGGMYLLDTQTRLTRSGRQLSA